MYKIEQKDNFYVQRLSVKFALRIAKCVLWNYIFYVGPFRSSSYIPVP